jgi:two-component SAPR family response regulator
LSSINPSGSARHGAAPTPQFFLLGRFVVRCADQDLQGFEGRKVQELLAYLIVAPRRPHHRERVAEVLWGSDALSYEPRKQLRQALWQLRLALRQTPGNEPIVLVENEWLQIARVSHLWADVWDLEDAASDVQGRSGDSLTRGHFEKLRQAVDLYRADLLEGWYRDWCVYERERLRTVYLGAVDKLLAYCETHGLPEEGLLYGERILAHDRAHERTHWRMMRLHLLSGDRTRALRQFDRCATALREELGIQPSSATILLRDQIRDDTPALFLRD